jgi:AmmeMemoRadiSam system protein A
MSGSPAELSKDERQLLLQHARRSVEAVANREPLPKPPANTPMSLLEQKACFVTLYSDLELRGCTGVLVARQPLIEEVIYTSASTAASDPRFSPVKVNEVASLTIEISVLTAPQQVVVGDPLELPLRIRPRIDGVTLRLGRFRGTFLPQVWEKIPEPTDFLGRLCEKMGLSYKAWKSRDMEVEVYQVEEFAED